MSIRRLLVIPLVVCTALGLTACGPPVLGSVGLMRQADGSLEVLIRPCRGVIDALFLDPINSYGESKSAKLQYPDNDYESEPHERSPITPPTDKALNLSMPFAEAALKRNVLYMLTASGHDGNAYSPHFSASELEEIPPGQVLTSTRDGNQTLDVQDFETSESVDCS